MGIFDKLGVREVILGLALATTALSTGCSQKPNLNQPTAAQSVGEVQGSNLAKVDKEGNLTFDKSNKIAWVKFERNTDGTTKMTSMNDRGVSLPDAIINGGITSIDGPKTILNLNDIPAVEGKNGGRITVKSGSVLLTRAGGNFEAKPGVTIAVGMATSDPLQQAQPTKDGTKKDREYMMQLGAKKEGNSYFLTGAGTDIKLPSDGQVTLDFGKNFKGNSMRLNINPGKEGAEATDKKIKNFVNQFVAPTLQALENQLSRLDQPENKKEGEAYAFRERIRSGEYPCTHTVGGVAGQQNSRGDGGIC